MPVALPLAQLRRYALARSLFKPTTLPKAIDRLGFVQADPLRAPARAQDLILRVRVAGYRAGDLERRYPRLAVEEDYFVNYGFLPRRHVALMHPRSVRRTWDAPTQSQAEQVLDFVRARGITHPRDVLAAFSHGRQAGYWGGTLNTSTQLLEGLHHRGLLRVVRRDRGTRLYEAVSHPANDDSPEARQARAASLVRLVVQLYAPLPAASLSYLLTLLRYGAHHLRAECAVAVKHLQDTGELASTTLDGVRWIWPGDENPASRRHREPEGLRILAPFDPVVWDRRRFELFWGWPYKFEAYVPPSRRRMGHYAQPVLWQGEMVGWANLKQVDGRLQHDLGWVHGRPADTAFTEALDAELQHLQDFLSASKTEDITDDAI